MPWYESGKVLFEMSKHFVFNIYCRPEYDPDSITSITMPGDITGHLSWPYDRFPELQEIITHPDNPRYMTYDGALYSKYGELLYVPLGKETLRLAPFLKRIGHRALWNRNRLKEIVLDPSNKEFQIFLGCLFSKDLRTVYFVVNPEKTLCLAAATENVSEDVLSQKPREIVIDDANPFFETFDGMLIQQGRLIYTGIRDAVRIPSSVTKISFNTAIELFDATENRTVSAESHPVFHVDNNALFHFPDKKLIYLSPKAHSLVIPDGFSLGYGSLFYASGLESLSVPADLPISNDPYCYKISNYIRKEVPPPRYTLTVRWPAGKTISFPGRIDQSFQIIRDNIVEVKGGTEILYLELYFAGKITDPQQKRNFAVSVFQIIKYLIDQNDLERFRRVIDDDHLITRKNIARLKTYAKSLDRAEIVRLMDNLRFQS